MDTYHLLIYGGGNSEIAASLEEEMSRLHGIQNSHLKIYSKTYLLVNSCYAMYKRFGSIKAHLGQVKSAGVYEYTYSGLDDCVKRQELRMGECSSPAEFEKFLVEGIDILKAHEIILILVGQSYGNGLFIDFYNNEPTQLTYEDLSGVLRRVGKKKGVYFHLIVDIPLWHGMVLPYEISQISSVASLFIWERSKVLKSFPITYWIEKSIGKGEHWMKVLYKEFEGYRIQPHSVWWKLCRLKWDEYIQSPCAKTWKSFYEQYKYVVTYKGNQQNGLMIPLQGTYKIDTMEDTILESGELIQYFKQCYGEIMMEEEMVQWLEEIKNCVTYYKL